MSVAEASLANDSNTTTQSPAAQSFGNSVVWLSGVSWENYEALRGITENCNVQMTYDEGDLILMSPGRLHERIAALLNRMVIAWTEERSIPLQSGGSTTIRAELRKKGFEPDQSYFIQHESDVRKRDDYDPSIDPPPDLTIEVDVSSLSTIRMGIYAAFGIPELWRWCDEQITVYRLRDGAYVEVDASECLPGFPFDTAATLLQRRLDLDETSLLQEFRAAIRHPDPQN
jgi:Uma2 family endonuclease